MSSLGGFQSGFSVRYTSKENRLFLNYLICHHDCKTVIQSISHVSGESEFELCAIEAERLGNLLFKAIREAKVYEEHL